MAKAQKTVSIRLEADDYNFLNSLAEAEREDLSTAVRDLIGRGRVLLALERYREGHASLSKAAELAGVSVSEMMDLLAAHGIPADLSSSSIAASRVRTFSSSLSLKIVISLSA
jgi:predicted HTH domain antitoxin